MSIRIQTTQNVILDLRAAGLGPRILARILDFVFLGLWSILWSIGLGGTLDYTGVFYISIVWIPIVFYDLLMEYFNNGQSLGKAIMRIKVVNLDGTTPSFGSYLIRWLFRLVDFLLTMQSLAVIMVAFSEKSQRLGDLLAGTTVITLKPEVNSGTLRFSDLDFHEDYTVTYTDLLNKLSDQDISVIRGIIKDHRYIDDSYTINILANKVKETTNYEYHGSDRSFLKKILDDYNYLSIQ